MFVLDLNDLDQTANDFSTGGKVRLVEAVANLLGEIIQPAEHRLQLLPLGSLFRHRSFVVF